MTGYDLRAVWPIRDDLVPGTDPTLSVMRQLVDEARADLPTIARRARATITGEPRFTARLSADVPGSGNVTRWCLVASVAATPAPARPYHRRTE